MEILIFIGGLIAGIILTVCYKNMEIIHGIIYVDHKSEQCMFNIRSDELSNPKKKTAVFIIDHNADLSREEQGL